MNKQKLYESVENRKQLLVDVKRFLYENPELGDKEFKASEKLISLLEAEHFTVKKGLSGYETAFRAEYTSGKGGKKAAVLLEYDALPEVGHACGHNFIAAAGLGAALTVKEMMDDIDGTLVVFGTPAEETLGSKVKMVEEGLFDDIDAAVMVHPSNGTDIYTRSLASRSFNIIFHGKASHAAANPEKGINALDAFVQFYVSLDLLKKQLRKDVRIPGIILDGGTAPNIVPARIEGKFTVRSLDWDYMQYAYKRVEKMAAAAAEAHGCTFEMFSDENPYRDMRTNRVLARRFEEHLDHAGIKTDGLIRDNFGSLDMGDVSHRVPSIHPMIGVCGDDVGGHTPEFREIVMKEESDDIMISSVKAMAFTLLDILTDTALMSEAEKEYKTK